MTITNSDTSPMTLESGESVADASARTTAIQITGNASNNSILGGTKNDTLYGAGGNDTVSGGAGADKLYGDAGNDVLNGDAGNDTLDGGSGNDTLTGGVGKDIFVYSGGNDVITDYAAGQDKITVDSLLAYSDFAISGNDVVLNYGSGNSLTVKDGKDTLLTVNSVAQIYTDNAVLNSNKTSATLTAATTEFNASVYSALVTIDGSAATRSIEIIGNAKANNITAGANGSTLDGGTGNDTLTGGAGNDSLTGGDGKNFFVFTAGNDTITDYTANSDKVSLGGKTISGVALSGNNIILGLGGTDSLTFADGKDKKITFQNGKASATYIFEDDKIFNSGKTAVSLTASAASFDASDAAYSALVTIDGSKASGAVNLVGNAKANKIFAGEHGSTLNGGAGNDNLTGGAGADVFVYTAGNDVINNYTSGTDTISLGADLSVSSFAVNTKTSDIAFTVGKNTFTIKKGDGDDLTSVGKAITIIENGTASTKTYYTNRAVADKGVTLNAAFTGSIAADSNFDTIDGSAAAKAIMINGNGNANVLKGGTKNDTINGGAGNDTLNGGAGVDKLYGDAGADKLYGDAGNDTLDGGAGNDTLTGGAGKDLFVYSGGADRILDYAVEDKISLDGATISGVAISGDNVVLNFGTRGDSLTIVDGKDKKVTFQDGKSSAVYIFGGNEIFNSGQTGVTLTSAVTEFDATAYSKLITIDGSAATSPINIIGNAKANQIIAGSGGSTLNGGAGNDNLTGGDGADLFVYTAGNDVIKDYNTTDSTDRISLGADLSVSKFSTNKTGDVIFTVGKNSITVKLNEDESIEDGKEITIVDDSGTSTKTYYADRSENDTGVTLNAAFSGTIEADSGIVTVDGSAVTKIMTIDGNDDDNFLAGGTKNDTINGYDGADLIDGNAGNDSILGDAGNDTLNGGAGNDSLYGDDDNDVLNGDAGNDVLHGGTGKDSLNGGAGNDKLYGESGNDVLNGDAGNDTILGGTGNDALNGGDGNDSLLGGDGKDTILGGAGNDKLFGDAGSDTLNGGAGNDTLTGGAGNDLFIFTGGEGNDVIADFAYGDRISLGADYTASAKGANVVFKIGKNTLTVQNVASSRLTIVDKGGTVNDSIIGGLTYNDKSKASVTLPAYAEYADASARTKAIAITGNDLNNTIIGGSGGNSITGGLGDDSLWGGNGADTFFYADGDGNDVIEGFGNDDLLQITGTWDSSCTTSAVTLTIGDGSIKLNDYSATTFNINDTAYEISGNKLVEKAGE